jgi:hypothetical protein
LCNFKLTQKEQEKVGTYFHPNLAHRVSAYDKG